MFFEEHNQMVKQLQSGCLTLRLLVNMNNHEPAEYLTGPVMLLLLHAKEVNPATL